MPKIGIQEITPIEYETIKAMRRNDAFKKTKSHYMRDKPSVHYVDIGRAKEALDMWIESTEEAEKLDNLNL